MVYFFTGFLMYLIIAYASYSDSFKKSGLYFPVGLAAALIANLIWLIISKQEPDTSKLVIKGLYWDAMLTLTYMLVPLFFFEAKLTAYQIAGLVLVLVGLGLTKI